MITYIIRQIQKPFPIVSVRFDALMIDFTSLSFVAIISIPGYLRLDLQQEIQIGVEIGVGGTASVFKGTLINPQRSAKLGGVTKVAVKMPKISHEDVEAFMYEVAIMSSIPHSSNLVTFVGYSETPHAIIMKYYQYNLRNMLNSNETNFPAMNMKLALDIAKGMNMIHSCGILHLDLKTGKK